MVEQTADSGLVAGEQGYQDVVVVLVVLPTDDSTLATDRDAQPVLDCVAGFGTNLQNRPLRWYLQE